MGDPRRRQGEEAAVTTATPSTPTCRPARSSCSRAEIEVLSQAKELPVPVFGEPDYPEDLRLTYRFLDLRRQSLHAHHHEAARHHQLDPPADARRGLQRIPDADPDRVEPGRRARLPGAVAHPSGQVLRAAAGAAAVQAVADGVGLRPLFPDRAVLSRRGPARGSPARRVLPARSRDELRRAGGRVLDDGADPHRAVRGVRPRARP